MDDGIKKKLMGAAAAAVAAFMFGGSQVMDIGERLDALEALHPELAEAETAAETAEESTDPAPGEEALKLNEDDEWVPAEEISDEPVEEVSEEVEGD
jgi:hypothetical protein